MSGLKIAASNICWSKDDDAAVLARMGELGFSGIEIAPTRVFDNAPYSKVAEFSAWAMDVKQQYRLAVCSMQSIWRGRTENIFDEDGAAALLDYTAEACTFAAAGGVGNLVFGCPGNRVVPEGHNGMEAADFLLACGALAADAGAFFALEANPPMYHTNFLNTTEEVIGYLDVLGDGRGLGINLDVGAMICANEDVRTVEHALPLVSHVHVSEPGLASIEPRRLHHELHAILEDAGYDGYVSLEMGCADFATVNKCLEYLAETFLG